jgi:hypothetical protein
VVWDLTPIDASDAEWDRDREFLVREIPGLIALRGSLSLNASSMRQGLDQIFSANRRFSQPKTLRSGKCGHNIR